VRLANCSHWAWYRFCTAVIEYADAQVHKLLVHFRDMLYMIFPISVLSTPIRSLVTAAELRHESHMYSYMYMDHSR
jgi:hypothetical protein